MEKANLKLDFLPIVWANSAQRKREIEKRNQKAREYSLMVSNRKKVFSK